MESCILFLERALGHYILDYFYGSRKYALTSVQYNKPTDELEQKEADEDNRGLRHFTAAQEKILCEAGHTQYLDGLRCEIEKCKTRKTWPKKGINWKEIAKGYLKQQKEEKFVKQLTELIHEFDQKEIENTVAMEESPELLQFKELEQKFITPEQQKILDRAAVA